MSVAKKAEITVVKDDQSVVVSFVDIDTDEIKWLENLAQKGKIKFSITVKYSNNSHTSV